MQMSAMMLEGAALTSQTCPICRVRPMLHARACARARARARAHPIHRVPPARFHSHASTVLLCSFAVCASFVLRSERA
ncbi:hypothetical protein EON67_05075 [archaeon]|nr:MAG: hypothetical protein EON67_05075 [archaeon]